MKFAEGLVSSLLLSLPPSRLPVRLPLLSVPLAPLPPGPFTTPSKSLFSLLLLLSSSNHQLPRHYGIANLPDLLQVIFAQNRFNSNLGIRLFLLYVSGIPLPSPSHITSTYVDCAYVCMCLYVCVWRVLVVMELVNGCGRCRRTFRHRNSLSNRVRIIGNHRVKTITSILRILFFLG